MNDSALIFILVLLLGLLSCVIVYQQFVFYRDSKTKCYEISETLKRILDTDSDEKVTVFTDNQPLIALVTQVNRILDDRQKAKSRL